MDGVRGGVENEPVIRRDVGMGPERVRGAVRRAGLGGADGVGVGVGSLPPAGGMIRRTRSATPDDMASMEGEVSVKLRGHSPLC